MSRQSELEDHIGSDDGGSDANHAVERDTVEVDGDELRQCLSLTVRGPWGHFRRVDGNTVKQTYRVMPRTTVAGLLAAIAGYPRDSYYDVFGPEVSGVAIEPITPLQTMNLPVNSLTTSNEGMKAVNARGKVSVKYPDPTKDRQRTNYEVLVDPAYRIDVWLDDVDAYDRLRSMLTTGKSYYTPSLGLSEYLATIEYHGQFTIESLDHDANGPIEVTSAVPDTDSVIPEPGTAYGTERSPGYMTRTSKPGEFTGRRTTSFLTYAYSPEAEPLRLRGVDAVRVDGRTVVFA